jgi:hypothetical protein
MALIDCAITGTSHPHQGAGVLPTRPHQPQSPQPAIPQGQAHVVRVVSLPDGPDATDYYAICSCGQWISGPRITERTASYEKCGIERAASEGRHGISRYLAALDRAVRHGA